MGFKTVLLTPQYLPPRTTSLAPHILGTSRPDSHTLAPHNLRYLLLKITGYVPLRDIAVERRRSSGHKVPRPTNQIPRDVCVTLVTSVTKVRATHYDILAVNTVQVPVSYAPHLLINTARVRITYFAVLVVVSQSIPTRHMRHTCHYL